MKNEPLFEQLREASWRRNLTPAEEAQLRQFLASHPEAQAEWDAEAALNESLKQLSAAPVPSNFTARVLDAVRREGMAEARAERHGWLRWHFRLRWLPRAAVATLIVGLGLVTYRHEQLQTRKERAESLMAVEKVKVLANPELLENFEVIQAMSQAPVADDELIKLLQ